MNTSPDISVVVLCYGCGEAARIFSTDLQKRLTDRDLNYELLLIGNYFPEKHDPTVQIIQNIARNDPRIKAITNSKKEKTMGMGWDMKSGLAAASGATIAVIDGDGQMPPEDVIRVYQELIKKNLDLVKTTRIFRYDSIWRRFISKIYNMCMHILFFPIAGTDMNAKPKIFTREAYRKLNLESNDWFIDAEIMIQAKRHHFRTGEIPTTFYAHKERESFISFKAIWEFIKNLIRYRWKELRH